MYDLTIVGMGPAGLTAAVYAARKKMSTLLLGKEYGGQVAWTSEVENYMGFQFISGPELITRFEEQVKQYPVEQKRVEVTQVGRQNGHFVTRTADGGEHPSRTLIIAAGKFPRRLDVPGEKKFTGHGVSYCAVCDAPLFSGMKVAVIGGGNSALEATIDLLKIAEHVYVISLEEWIADPVLVEKVKDAPNMTKLVGYKTLSINGDKTVESITMEAISNPGEKKDIEVRGVFIEIGTVPSSNFVEGLLEMNNYKEIVVDCDCKTSIPGIFAAGDITNIPEKQVIVAAGEGAKSSLGAYKFLLNQR